MRLPRALLVLACAALVPSAPAVAALPDQRAGRAPEEVPATPQPAPDKAAAPAQDDAPPEDAGRTPEDPGKPEHAADGRLDGKPEKPAVGKRVVVTPSRGAVTVLLPGQAQAVPLGSVDDLPVGTVVDTRRGAIVLRSADAAGTEQAAAFHGGAFEVRQAADGYVDLHLRGPRGTCPKRAGRARAATAAARRKRRPHRRLWGSDDHGRFRTHGRDAVATVRGTRWLVQERCDGTLTRVVQGAVDVRDKRTGRTVRVVAGSSYLARRARP